jgi:hypothetical protein
MDSTRGVRVESRGRWGGGGLGLWRWRGSELCMRRGGKGCSVRVGCIVRVNWYLRVIGELRAQIGWRLSM